MQFAIEVLQRFIRRKMLRDTVVLARRASEIDKAAASPSGRESVVEKLRAEVAAAEADETEGNAEVTADEKMALENIAAQKEGATEYWATTDGLDPQIKELLGVLKLTQYEVGYAFAYLQTCHCGCKGQSFHACASPSH